MAHSANVISSIKLPNGTTYEIHDAQALHSIEDLGLAGVLQFKGVVAKYADLPTTGNRIGDVYHVTGDDYEYVWIDSNKDGSGDKWEEFGAAHDFISTDVFNAHKHSISASGTVPSHTASGNVTIPTVSATKATVGGTAAAPTITKSSDKVLGEATTFTTTITGNGLGAVSKTGLKASVGNVAVASNGTTAAVTKVTPKTKTFVTGVTPSTASVIGSVTSESGAAVTGLGTPTTASAIATLSTTSIKNPSVTAVTVTEISSNTSVTAS
jgi:hypothetical protein